MPVSGWIMFVVACIVLYGGLGLCILIALKKTNKKN